jgi:hypothetical protein
MTDRENRVRKDRKVHVTALYTATAAEKRFVAEQNQTVQQVLDEAYRRLGESRRTDDQYFCHRGEPQPDLAQHLSTTLETLAERGICIDGNGRDKLEFEIDINVTPGGAS